MDRFGGPTSTNQEISRVMHCVWAMYGGVLVKPFGLVALRAVRQKWIEADLTITTINSHCGQVRAMFKWGVSHQLVTNDVYQAICTVPGLRRGRGIGRDTSPRQVVPRDHVEATLKHLPSPLRAIVRLLLMTGARPAQIFLLGAGRNHSMLVEIAMWASAG